MYLGELIKKAFKSSDEKLIITIDELSLSISDLISTDSINIYKNLNELEEKELLQESEEASLYVMKINY
jgi:hypothetical protein